MKTFIAALAAMVIGTSAYAVESWQYSEHGHWIVDIVQFDDGVMACAAANVDSEVGIGLTVWDFNDGTYEIQITDETFNFRGTTGEIAWAIDQGAIWYGPAFFNNSAIFVDQLTDVEMLVEIMNGNTFYVLDRDDYITHEFSLHGSRAAIESMIRCAGQIDNTGPNYNEGFNYEEESL
jgi:uncharacterized protein YdeI (BOF family)